MARPRKSYFSSVIVFFFFFFFITYVRVLSLFLVFNFFSLCLSPSFRPLGSRTRKWYLQLVNVSARISELLIWRRALVGRRFRECDTRLPNACWNDSLICDFCPSTFSTRFCSPTKCSRMALRFCRRSREFITTRSRPKLKLRIRPLRTSLC